MKMSRRYILWTLLMYFMFLQVAAQTKKTVNEENDRMVLAYSFYLKQKMSLEFVSVRFPKFKEYVENTLNEWNREFMPSVNNMDSALTANLSDDWAKNKNELYEKYIRIDYSGTSEDQAKEFIDVVNDRTYGRIQSPILETYLIWNPKYQKSPEKEFIDGYVSKFSTKEQRNPLPINLKLVYPRSWKAIEGNKKANIAQTFISGYGLGNVTLNLVIEKSKNNYTKDNINQLLTQETMQKAFRSGEKVIDFKSNSTIDNCKAATIFYSWEKVREDAIKIYSIGESYTTYYKNFKITLNFTILASSAEEAMARYKKHQNLIKRIVDNVVILSQWGQ